MAGLNLQPEWVEELLVQWVSVSVLNSSRPRRAVSPMFEMLGAVCEEQVSDEPEVQALCRALEKLHAENEAHWQAIQRAFKPWKLAPAGDQSVHVRTLHAAALRLAELVDLEMGE